MAIFLWLSHGYLLKIILLLLLLYYCHYIIIMMIKIDFNKKNKI